ncbi:MAG: tetraacyldisaccharide 4'-kinase [Holosporaceae bacterium]|jgi:tetraacyldisaccharide 4'-kinase|nr:tetraacyldisaccharide 4'-kinase [Holosporaceae bacterium]
MLSWKAPRFWYRSPALLLKIILKPIAKIYSFISTRNYKKEYKYRSSKAKVIAVGGITVGGSGKTMVVRSICKILKAQNKKVAILSRGYGRSGKDTLLVDGKIHSYQNVGDEPFLLSSEVPVYVGEDRFESAMLAEASGYEFLILDDGITQKFLKPDIKLVVVDNEQRFGNGEMLPLGPNRLNFEKIKEDIDGIIILGRGKKRNFINAYDIPVFYGEIHQDFSKIKKKKIIVFCGIGYPDKFFDSFVNFETIEKIAFSDHYPFSSDDMEKLILKANNCHAQLVTTEKDFVRIPAKYRSAIIAVSAQIFWEDSIDTIISF